ncbi:MAG: 1-acyl-sn-glycerol-3-phosphate acyltransferase [Roseburia sp.]|nr:1-acyl-sn-glycerol-3-phosphate acyltransferase [Anaeroplasma bactoclasticum]MCM1197091.1 1-acyl-sn-glycerol-3-phosphate acyltransferase [Roseburia sp.]MCM1557359.1 1-acyl-sn-glycerol-3-phosphate acyltransferase [Anaeroplasma bactoclasticum]
MSLLILAIILLVLSIGASGAIYYFTHLYFSWYFLFVPILLIPILYVVIFGIYLIILFIISLFLNQKKEIKNPNRFYYFWVRQTILQLLFFSRTKVKVIGKELLEKNKRYLVVSNHISNFDPLLFVAKLKLQPLICVTKKENLKIPICGPFIHRAGFISLDREDAHSGVQMVRKAADFIARDLASIYICPEGTRSKTTELLPFHPGSFKIATKVGTDIAVCYVENTNLIAKNFPFRSTKTILKIAKVIPKEEVLEKRTTELAFESEKIIKKEKEHLSNELFII